MIDSEKYSKLIAVCAPHPVFSSDWLTFTDAEFADALLPDAGLVKGTNLYFFDGAELLPKGCRFSNRFMRLPDGKAPLVTMYSYPKEVKAAQRRGCVQPQDNELCLFFEISQNEKIEVYINAGSRLRELFTQILKEQKSSSKVSVDALKPFQTDKESFQHYFNDEFSHYKTMQYVASMLNVDFENIFYIRLTNIRLEYMQKPAWLAQSSANTQSFIRISVTALGHPMDNYDLSIQDGSGNTIVSYDNNPAPEAKRVFNNGKATDSFGYVIRHDIEKEKLNSIIKQTALLNITARDDKGRETTVSKEIKMSEKTPHIDRFIAVLDETTNEEIYISREDIIEWAKMFKSRIPKSLFGKIDEKGQLILNLPIIMAKLGWLYSALCQIHWLEGSGASLKFPYQFFLSEKRVKDVDIKSLSEYFKSLAYMTQSDMMSIEGGKNNISNNKVLYDELQESVRIALFKVKDKLKNAVDGDKIGGDETFINNKAEWDEIKSDENKIKETIMDNLFHSFSYGSTIGDFDDLGASIGMFRQPCYYRGYIEINKEIGNKIHITNILCRFFDEFSFDGDQNLGNWVNDTTQPTLPIRNPLEIDFGNYIYLNNIYYQELRNTLNSNKSSDNICCRDFFIYSPTKTIQMKDILSNGENEKAVPFI